MPRTRVSLGVSCILIGLVLSCPAPAPPPEIRPIVGQPASTRPVLLSLTRIDDRSVNARLAAHVGAAVIDVRNEIDQTRSSTPVDPANPRLVLRSPWTGELRVTAGADSAFVAVVVQPLLGSPVRAPETVYGPQGRVVVRFQNDSRVSAGSHIFIASPAISTPINPAGLIGDPVEIGLVPAGPTPTAAVVGLTPWLPPTGATLAIHVFDRATQTWSALHSHVSRDGTVFANALIPGVFAVKVTP